MSGNFLELPVTIEELIEHREKQINAWKSISEAIKSVSGVSIRGGGLSLLDHRKAPDKSGYLERYPTDNFYDENKYPHNIEEQIRALDYSLWIYLIDHIRLSRIMTGEDKSKFLGSVRDVGVKFCREEIDAFSMTLDSLFHRSSAKTIQGVYKRLIATHYNGLINGKRDNLQKIEPLFRISGTNFEYTSSYSSYSNFDWNDLLLSCYLIEGKGSTDYSNNFYAILHTKRERHDVLDVYGYFTLQCFKNRNVRCKWNPEKQHILDKLNLIGSGDWNNLPDSMRKRYKPEHFGEEHNKEDFRKVFDYTNQRIEVVEDKDFAFFPTPDNVVDQMIKIADFDQLRNVHEIRVLEPSCGTGAIAKKIPRQKNIHLKMIEYNTYRVEKLEDYFREVRDQFGKIDIQETDFLNYWGRWNESVNYHRILMNPPFHQKVEMYHTVKAFNLLAPGGILVGILPTGSLTNTDSKSKVFQEFLKKYQYQEPVILESGTFKKTGVKTAIISLIKPFMED